MLHSPPLHICHTSALFYWLHSSAHDLTGCYLATGVRGGGFLIGRFWIVVTWTVCREFNNAAIFCMVNITPVYFYSGMLFCWKPVPVRQRHSSIDYGLSKAWICVHSIHICLSACFRFKCSLAVSWQTFLLENCNKLSKVYDQCWYRKEAVFGQNTQPAGLINFQMSKPNMPISFLRPLYYHIWLSLPSQL